MCARFEGVTNRPLPLCFRNRVLVATACSGDVNNIGQWVSPFVNVLAIANEPRTNTGLQVGVSVYPPVCMDPGSGKTARY